MKAPELTNKWRVDLIESEKGWGQRLEEVKYFYSLAEAEKFVKEFNSKNTSTIVPYWYMYAMGPMKVR